MIAFKGVNMIQKVEILIPYSVFILIFRRHVDFEVDVKNMIWGIFSIIRVVVKVGDTVFLDFNMVVVKVSGFYVFIVFFIGI